MKWVVATDQYTGTLPVDVTWGSGLRGYVGWDAPLVVTYSGAKHFQTVGEAEAAALSLAVYMPILLGHLHVLEEPVAAERYKQELMDWITSKGGGVGGVSLAG